MREIKIEWRHLFVRDKIDNMVIISKDNKDKGQEDQFKVGNLLWKAGECSKVREGTMMPIIVRNRSELATERW